MDLAFGDGDPFEHGDGPLFDPIREVAIVNQLADLAKIPVRLRMRMCVVVRMGMRVGMGDRRFSGVRVFVDLVGMRLVTVGFDGMLVRMVVGGAVGVGMGVFVKMGEVDVELDTGDEGFLAPSAVQMIVRDRQFTEFGLELIEVHAEVDQGTDEHVAADPAEEIEVEGVAVVHSQGLIDGVGGWCAGVEGSHRALI